MKWFMSYVKVYNRDGRTRFGSCVCRDEHPVAVVNRWNAKFGESHGFSHALLSFQQVGDDVPDMDTEVGS